MWINVTVKSFLKHRLSVCCCNNVIFILGTNHSWHRCWRVSKKLYLAASWCFCPKIKNHKIQFSDYLMMEWWKQNMPLFDTWLTPEHNSLSTMANWPVTLTSVFSTRCDSLYQKWLWTFGWSLETKIYSDAQWSGSSRFHAEVFSCFVRWLFWRTAPLNGP